ncbi:hypothetical protein AVEN_82099-1, partial [Araneus ventricosus]
KENFCRLLNVPLLGLPIVTMICQLYSDEAVLLHVLLLRGIVGDKFVLMDASYLNAPCHRTLAVQDCEESKDIRHLVWPVHSPDLNSIENV